MCIPSKFWLWQKHKVLSVNSAWFSNVPLTSMYNWSLLLCCPWMLANHPLWTDTVGYQFNIIVPAGLGPDDLLPFNALMHKFLLSLFASFSTVDWLRLLFCLRFDCSHLQSVYETFIMIIISACCTAVDNSSTALDLFFRMPLTNTLPFLLHQNKQCRYMWQKKVK